MRYNVDLHIHSPYASGVSKNMAIPLLAKEAKLKGLDILGTGDILHPLWLEHCREWLREKAGCFYFKDDTDRKTYFILSTEVETSGRAHHLLFFSDFEKVLEFRKDIEKFSSDMMVYGGGRPRLSLNPQELLGLCLKHDVLIGPAHAFTPYFGIYAGYDSLEMAYGKQWEKVLFIELGLSADTSTANLIPELKNKKFFSFSDAHSPNSYRIGREFVCMELEKPNYESLKNLLCDVGKNQIVYNVGYNPKEGKYNKTACRDCWKIYGLEDAIKLGWRCSSCKGILKKGVEDRIKEIAKKQGNNQLKQITNRPEYKYLMPLYELIQMEIGKKGSYEKCAQEKYEKIISRYTEIEIMLEVQEEKLREIDNGLAGYIMAFRKGLVAFRPGGAGHYGTPFICQSEEEKRLKEEEISREQDIKYIQKTLF